MGPDPVKKKKKVKFHSEAHMFDPHWFSYVMKWNKWMIGWNIIWPHRGVQCFWERISLTHTGWEDPMNEVLMRNRTRLRFLLQCSSSQVFHLNTLKRRAKFQWACQRPERSSINTINNSLDSVAFFLFPPIEREKSHLLEIHAPLSGVSSIN